LGWRRIRSRARRRHHDDAGSLQVARRGADPRASGRHHRGIVLMKPKGLGIVATDAAPKAIGPYSQAVVVDGTVYTAGQIALDPVTGEVVGRTATVQAAGWPKGVRVEIDAIARAG